MHYDDLLNILFGIFLLLCFVIISLVGHISLYRQNDDPTVLIFDLILMFDSASYFSVVVVFALLASLVHYAYPTNHARNNAPHKIYTHVDLA